MEEIDRNNKKRCLSHLKNNLAGYQIISVNPCNYNSLNIVASLGSKRDTCTW